MTSEPPPSEQGAPAYGEDESQDFVDRSIIDFDPADGLYTGTAVDGTSEIPGPHEPGRDAGD